MSATATRVDLDGFRSWFNNTDYKLMESLDNKLSDPIYSLLGEYDDSSKSDTISVTGRDNSGFAATKLPGGKINKQAAVEEDQMNKGFMSFAETSNIEWESVIHDKYRYADEQPAEIVDKVMDSASLLLHHQLFNFGTASSVTMEGTHGSYGLTVPSGQNLFSSSHSGPGYSSKSNLVGTGALSNANLIANIQHGNENMVTSNGTAIPYTPDLLIVPNDAAMVEAAIQITKSDKVYSSANNATNIFSDKGIKIFRGGSMSVVVLPFAPRTAAGAYDTAKQYYWQTADSMMLKKAIKYKWAARPTVASRFVDPENLDSYFSVAARLAVVAQRWQGINLNNSTTIPVTAS